MLLDKRSANTFAAARAWLDRRVLFFGGKGGVGKTTSATAFALLTASLGRRTLLVSTDPAHSSADILERFVGNGIQKVRPNLWVLELDSEKEADSYIQGVSHTIRSQVKPNLRSEIDRQIRMARVSPGAQEAALFDRIAELIESSEEDYDRIVFDTAPTGHTIHLLALPEMMEAWIDGLISRRKQVNEMSALWKNMTLGSGAEQSEDPVEKVLQNRKRKFAKMRRVLLDEEQTAFIFVLNPERLPIVETEKAIHMLREHKVPVGGIVINRVLPSDLPDHGFFRSRKHQEQEYLNDIAKRFAKMPSLRLPLLDRDVVGEEPLEQIVTHLREALDLPLETGGNE
ncbi:MAG: ArsA family ATPase [Spirochaetales bacterium]